jgi:hypothetical protein
VHGEFVLPKTSLGWIGFAGAAGFYAFAIIAFYIAISMIGPVHVSLLSYAEPVAAAGLGVTLLGEALAPIQIAGIALVVTTLIGAVRESSIVDQSSAELSLGFNPVKPKKETAAGRTHRCDPSPFKFGRRQSFACTRPQTSNRALEITYRIKCQGLSVLPTA